MKLSVLSPMSLEVSAHMNVFIIGVKKKRGYIRHTKSTSSILLALAVYSDFLTYKLRPGQVVTLIPEEIVPAVVLQ